LLPMILKVLLDSKPEVALEIVIAAKGKEWRMSASCEVLDVVSPHLHTALSLSLCLSGKIRRSGGNWVLDWSSCCWYESSLFDGFFSWLLLMILKVLLD
jgi:hypothetical protein